MGNNFFDGERMTGDKDKIANGCVGAIAKLAHIGIAQMTEAPEKAVFLCGTAIPGLSGLAILFAHPDKQNAMCNHQTPEDMAFGCLYMLNAVEEHPDGVCCGYSPLILAKAMEMFKTLYGREYTNIHPDLREAIEKRLNEASEVPAHLKKFLPH